ncbi:hypothetical protein [Allorhizocola rhizosphaerae]|uniref:hypothetical protein n=1 Tax=Allorhizocola rhizosphaerae TaxID=1872709 RepID=UPI001FE320B9|nr:hypothetical protein [Allorhizocola rhizosphaerae]
MGIRAVIAALSLIGSMLVVQATLPGVAQARCKGADNEITSHLIINEIIAVSEVPVTGTCNENHYYQANFRSHYTGWRASVWVENNGWVGYYGPFGTAWDSYSFNDGASAIPGTAAIHLCLDNGTTWYCGWGDDYNVGNAVNHNIYGTNYGF